MGITRKHIVTKFFWFLMALHILNLSVDSPDPQPDSVPEDLSINDMESIVEIILEQMLDIEDAVPETDDDDTSQGLLSHTNFQLVYYQQQIDLLCKPDGQIANSTKSSFYYDAYSQQFHPEVVPPPPKA